MRERGGWVLVIVLLAGCSPSGAPAPAASRAITPVPQVPQIPYRYPLKRSQDQFLPADHLARGEDGVTLVLRASEIRGLLDRARKGHGGAQRALFRIALEGKTDDEALRHEIVELATLLAQDSNVQALEFLGQARLTGDFGAPDIANALLQYQRIAIATLGLEGHPPSMAACEATGKVRVPAWCQQVALDAPGLDDAERAQRVQWRREIADLSAFTYDTACDHQSWPPFMSSSFVRSKNLECKTRIDALRSISTVDPTAKTARLYRELGALLGTAAASERKAIQAEISKLAPAVAPMVKRELDLLEKCEALTDDLSYCSGAASTLDLDVQTPLGQYVLIHRRPFGSCASMDRFWDVVEENGATPNTDVATRLAACALAGKEVPQDFEKAAALLRLSVLSEFEGQGDAAVVLAQLYASRLLGPPDPLAAYFLLNWHKSDAAADQFLPAVSRSDLMARLEPESIRGVHKRVKEFEGIFDSFASGPGSVLAWLDYFDLVPMQLVEGSSGRTAQSKSVQGTGFVVSAEGAVITNAHVVGGCAVLSGSPGDLSLHVVSVDKANDLALLSGGPTTVPTMAFRAGALKLGEPVHAVGFPLSGLLGSGLTATSGSITALAGPGNDSRIMQISAPVQPGNSGGPLIDASGQVVGVVVASLDAGRVLRATGALPQNVNYAIRASVVTGFMEVNGAHPSVQADSRALSASEAIARASSSVLELRCSPASGSR